jgi:hypothetical protein
MTQDSVMWKDTVNMVINFRVSRKVGKFFTNYSFSKTILLHGVSSQEPSLNPVKGHLSPLLILTSMEGSSEYTE